MYACVSLVIHLVRQGQASSSTESIDGDIEDLKNFNKGLAIVVRENSAYLYDHPSLRIFSSMSFLRTHEPCSPTNYLQLQTRASLKFLGSIHDASVDLKKTVTTTFRLKNINSYCIDHWSYCQQLSQWRSNFFLRA